MTTTRDKEKTKLFNFVDEGPGNSIRIAYRNKHKEEALEFIKGMPIILREYLGCRAWTWFDKETSNKLSGYKWIPEKGLSSPNEDLLYNDLNLFTKNQALQETTEEEFLNPESRPQVIFEWDFNRISGIEKDGGLDISFCIYGLFHWFLEIFC